MMDEIKRDLIRDYGEREPKHFRQIDGFHMPGGGDSVMRPDDDGHCIMGGDTWELMRGASVRVLVPSGENTPPADVAGMLRKIADWIEQDPKSTMGVQAPPRDLSNVVELFAPQCDDKGGVY